MITCQMNLPSGLGLAIGPVREVLRRLTLRELQVDPDDSQGAIL